MELQLTLVMFRKQVTFLSSERKNGIWTQMGQISKPTLCPLNATSLCPSVYRNFSVIFSEQIELNVKVHKKLRSAVGTLDGVAGDQ